MNRRTETYVVSVGTTLLDAQQRRHRRGADQLTTPAYH